MMTHDEMIAVIRAHAEGESIEVLGPSDGTHWQETYAPDWDFKRCRYRIASKYQLRPHWPAVIYIKSQSRWIVTDQLYDSIEAARNGEASSVLTGEIRLLTEYPPVMLP